MTRIKEKRRLAVWTARMLKNKGKKTMRMLQQQVESPETTIDGPRQRTTRRTIANKDTQAGNER